MADAGSSRSERLRDRTGRLAIVLQQMMHIALRSARPYTGQAAKCGNQRIECSGLMRGQVGQLKTAA
jgi:hypothetical protein